MVLLVSNQKDFVYKWIKWLKALSMESKWIAMEEDVRHEGALIEYEEFEVETSIFCWKMNYLVGESVHVQW